MFEFRGWLWSPRESVKRENGIGWRKTPTQSKHLRSEGKKKQQRKLKQIIICSFVHLFNKWMLGSFSGPGAILHAGVTSKEERILSLLKFFQNKQEKCQVVINHQNRKRVTWWRGIRRALEQNWSALGRAGTWVAGLSRLRKKRGDRHSKQKEQLVQRHWGRGDGRQTFLPWVCLCQVAAWGGCTGGFLMLLRVSWRAV